MNCQFVILLDTRPNQPTNTFQTLGKDGQPVIIFTLAMLAAAQNDDELAFVLGHESAHHIWAFCSKSGKMLLLTRLSLVD